MKAKDLRVTYAEMVIESEYDSRMSMFVSLSFSTSLVPQVLMYL